MDSIHHGKHHEQKRLCELYKCFPQFFVSLPDENQMPRHLTDFSMGRQMPFISNDFGGSKV